MSAINFYDECKILKEKGYSQQKAADALEISRRTLITRLKKGYNIKWSEINEEKSELTSKDDITTIPKSQKNASSPVSLGAQEENGAARSPGGSNTRSHNNSTPGGLISDITEEEYKKYVLYLANTAEPSPQIANMIFSLLKESKAISEAVNENDEKHEKVKDYYNEVLNNVYS